MTERNIEQFPLTQIEHYFGCFEVSFDSWKSFCNSIPHHGRCGRRPLYRGQSDSGWKLEPSLHRGFRIDEDKSLHGTEILWKAWDVSIEMEKTQLANFKRASCGRCNLDFDSNPMQWWALGQHNGLHTPLLDWTASPYVALFFAFAESGYSTRSIFILNRDAVKSRMDEIVASGELHEPAIQFISPLSHENVRLAHQSGTFTKSLPAVPFEVVVNAAFARDQDTVALVKAVIPSKNESERYDCLRHLNLMNINYASLFPDLEGAAKHCNLMREIENY